MPASGMTRLRTTRSCETSSTLRDEFSRSMQRRPAERRDEQPEGGQRPEFVRDAEHRRGAGAAADANAEDGWQQRIELQGTADDLLREAQAAGGGAGGDKVLIQRAGNAANGQHDNDPPARSP